MHLTYNYLIDLSAISVNFILLKKKLYEKYSCEDLKKGSTTNFVERNSNYGKLTINLTVRSLKLEARIGDVSCF